VPETSKSGFFGGSWPFCADNGPVNAPRGLGADGRRYWRGAVATLEAIGLDVEPVAEPLGRLCVLVDDLAAARGAWDGRFTDAGSAGQERKHPLVGVMADLRREILELEGELALTPAGQRKLGRPLFGGRPPGAASAPDRAARPPRWQLKAVETGA
jgi:phage terminase small subunit